MDDLLPYQEALRLWNQFRGYSKGGKTNLERLQEGKEKRDFLRSLRGESYERAMREWEAEYQDLINEDNKLCNRYRDLLAEHRKELKNRPSNPLPEKWAVGINPESMDRWQHREDQLTKGKKTFGYGTTGDSQD